MKVKNVMHAGVTWVSPDATIGEIAKKMRDEDIGAVPVGESDRLVGMVTDRDITCRGLANGHDISKMRARDVMTKPIVYCSEDDDLDSAVKKMEKKAIRRLPVLNDKRRMVGILSLGDISGKAPRTLSGEVLEAVSAHHA
jgi:CBS domain-containing protein